MCRSVTCCERSCPAWLDGGGGCGMWSGKEDGGYWRGEANLVGADDEGQAVVGEESLGHVRPEADTVRPAVRRPRHTPLVLRPGAPTLPGAAAIPCRRPLVSPLIPRLAPRPVSRLTVALPKPHRPSTCPRSLASPSHSCLRLAAAFPPPRVFRHADALSSRRRASHPLVSEPRQ